MENNDDSIPRKIIKVGANLPNTDPYWMNRRQELEGFTFFRRKETKYLAAWFITNCMAELHWKPLINLLAKYISTTTRKDEDDVRSELTLNSQYLRKQILENLHIATLMFDARSKNFVHTVGKTLFQTDDFFYRYEFAKSRGQIHTHGILFSKAHAKKVEDALDLTNPDLSEDDRAKRLFEWLQTQNCNEDGASSPLLTSMHPAGGEQILDEFGGINWQPNKEEWARPEGTQEPPPFNPLMQDVTEFCTSEEKVNELHTYIVNRIALHQCNGYCLRKKTKDSDTKYCRVHYGKQDPITKKTPGKELHPFAPCIT